MQRTLCFSALNRRPEARGRRRCAPSSGLARRPPRPAGAGTARRRSGRCRAFVAFLAPRASPRPGPPSRSPRSLVEAALEDGGSLARACCGELRWLLCLDRKEAEAEAAAATATAKATGPRRGLEGSMPRLLSLLCGAPLCCRRCCCCGRRGVARSSPPSSAGPRREEWPRSCPWPRRSRRAAPGGRGRVRRPAGAAVARSPGAWRCCCGSAARNRPPGTSSLASLRSAAPSSDDSAPFSSTTSCASP